MKHQNAYSFFLSIILVFTFISKIEAQDAWSKLSNFPNGLRARGVAFSIGDRVYFGQGTPGGINNINDFWAYNVKEDTWDSISTIPGNSLIGATGFSYKNFGFVGLGQSSATVFSRAFYRYNSDSNTWVRIADFPGAGRNYAASFVIGNTAYVGCGNRGTSTLKDFYAFNMENNVWTKLTDLPGLARSSAFSFSTQGKGYVLCGGNYTQSGGDVLLKDVYEFDPKTNNWTQKGDFPGENREDGASFSFESFGIIALGQNETIYSNEVWEYNSSTDTWINRASFTANRRRNIAFCVNKNQGYILGGTLGTVSTSEVYSYKPLSTSTSEVGNQLKDLKTFPNPFSTSFNITGLNNVNNYRYDIFDLKGVTLFQDVLLTEEINIDLSSGVYFLRIKDSKNSVDKTLVLYKQ